MRKKASSRSAPLPAVAALGCLLAAMVPASGVFADEPTDVAADLAIVQPLIGESTVLVVKVDPARLDLPDLADVLQQAIPEAEDAYRFAERVTAESIESFREAAGEQPVYATFGIPLSETEWPVFFFLKSAPEVDREGLLEQLRAGVPAMELDSVVREGRLIVGPGIDGELAPMLDALVPSPREELEEALEAVAAYPVQVLLLPPDHVRRTVVELMPELPRPLGGGPSDVLTDGLLWAAFGLDPARLRAELVIQSASEEFAVRLAEAATERKERLFQLFEPARPEAREAIETFESLLALMAPEVEGDRVLLRIDQAEPARGLLRLIAMAATAIEDTFREAADTEKFRQILLAMHNYHDTHRMFPPRDDVRDDQGRTGLSWRVHLLPYLDESDLYQEFRLDEPWDSDHNRPLVARIPVVYRSQSAEVAPGDTTFLAPVGEGTVFGGPKATTFADIRDGVSNTVILVEVKPDLAVPWTAPKDYTFDPESPGQGLQRDTDGRFIAGFADGSTRRPRADADPEMLLRGFQKASGKPIDWDAFD